MTVENVPRIKWDGKENSYIPARDFTSPDSVPIHAEVDEAMDFATYEVIRHSLWAINVQHGKTIVRVSGSPIALFSHDFNPTIHLEDGETVMSGPWLQVLCGAGDNGIRWTLENRGVAPGISDGDMWLINDPWIAVNHQSDVLVACPVFWEGRLFAWVANVLHAYDIGGSTAGSFCSDARDVFDEPLPFPPTRIVAGGELCEDVADLFARQSRMPTVASLDLRSQIAGCNVARERMLGLVERYGPAVVKGVMRKVVDDCEKTFEARLAQIPDGTWRERAYIDGKGGDGEASAHVLTVEKRGTELILSNEGTAAAAGAANGTFALWRGGILSVLLPLFAHDQMFSTGGLLRRLRFEPTPGTLTCAAHPAAVSSGPPVLVGNIIYLANNCFARMVGLAPDLAEEYHAGNAASGAFAMTSLSGRDQWGRPFGAGLLDIMAGAIGAFGFRDGVGSGGFDWDPQNACPNVELNEHFYPVLYLYRREAEDSSGQGRFRGGNTLAFAFTPHGTEQIDHATIGGGCGFPIGVGLHGGTPTSSVNGYAVVQGGHVLDAFGAGRIPQDLREVGGVRETLPPHATGLKLMPGDAYEVRMAGALGVGDPLERDLELVAADLEARAVSPQIAAAVYGVVIGVDGKLDQAASEAARGEIRRGRLAAAPAPAATGGGEGVTGPSITAGPRLGIHRGDGALAYCCTGCERSLAPVGDDLRAALACVEVPVAETADLIPPTAEHTDTDLRFRLYVCPGCGVALDSDIAAAGEPHFEVMSLDEDSLRDAFERLTEGSEGGEAGDLNG